MGSFYVNVTLLGTDLASVRAAQPGPAFAFAEDGVVVLLAAVDDEQQLVTVGPLSAALGCVALGVGVHDSDILFYEVHRDGEEVTGGTIPDMEEYFADVPSGAPPPDPAALVAALGQGDVDALRAAFDAAFVFAEERHSAVVAALGLPSGAVGIGYRYAANGEVPAGADLTSW